MQLPKMLHSRERLNILGMLMDFLYDELCKFAVTVRLNEAI